MANYYYIYDLEKVGKVDGNGDCWLLEKDGWHGGHKAFLAINDRLNGFDDTEPPESPYRFGNSEVTSKIKVITEEEAKKYAAAENILWPEKNIK